MQNFGGRGFDGRRSHPSSRRNPTVEEDHRDAPRRAAENARVRPGGRGGTAPAFGRFPGRPQPFDARPSHRRTFPLRPDGPDDGRRRLHPLTGRGTPTMNWRKAVGACAAALIAAGGSALVATSATADVLGTIEADRDGGTVTDNPFAVLTTSGKCPGFGLLVLDKAADPVEIPSDPSRWIAPFSAGDGDTQHTITPGKSMAEARSDLSDGMWELRALCATDDGSAIAGHFALPIRITGQDWEVVQVQATTTELAVTPAGPVEEGTEITLTATVTPAEAAGTVSFRAGGTPLREAEVSGGTATLTTSELPAGERARAAEFTPADPERDSSSGAEEVPLTVTAAAGGDEDPPGPVFSVVDADGNELGPDPELAPGQTITITAPGFDADETVNLKLTTEPYGDPAPDPAPSPAPSAPPRAQTGRA